MKRSTLHFAISFLLSTILVPGCGFQLDECTAGDARPGVHLTCPVPGHTDRAFDLHLPPAWDGVTPLPVIFAFHGGGGNRLSAARVTCPDGDTKNPSCLVPVATAAGFAVALPDGTGSRPLRNIRTWNAGGGFDGWNCTSGGACHSGVDDMHYLDDLLSKVRRIIPVDDARIHATGISNGGAISHRWACQRPETLASIAPVGGANQFEAVGGTCGGPVAVLQIHGTADPCWTYEASENSCIGGENDGVKAGVAETVEAWRVRNGCAPAPADTPFSDLNPDDGSTATLLSYSGCEADVLLLRIDGGGHTWPNGYAYLGTDRIGRVNRDFDGNTFIVEFFFAHPKTTEKRR
jgi:polyhydroxybutyrate depolymerase